MGCECAMSVTRRMPCIEGRQHKFADGPWGRRCTTCDGYRFDLVERCGLLNCGDDEYAIDGRLVLSAEWWGGEPEWLRIEDKGTCDWCREKHRREDQRRTRAAYKALDERRFWKAAEARRDERDKRWMEWQLERTARLEVRRQRQMLRQGHQTLTAIRQHLRSPGRSPLPESRPAKTSPTS